MVIVKQVCCDVRDFSGSFPQELTTTLSLKTCSDVPKFFFHRILTIQDKNHRHRTACSKTRAEVRGGGRKPWKQKGTGKARAGSSTSPLWKGGGVIFGPKPIVYKKKINTKERYLAISTGLYVSAYKIVVIRNLVTNIEQFRTKVFLRFLGDFGTSLLSKKVLIVTCKITRELYLSCRNIKNVALVSSRTLTLRHILLADTILIVEEALSEFMDHSVNDFVNA